MRRRLSCDWYVLLPELLNHVNTLLSTEMYTPVLGQSPLVDSWFIRLRKKISLEIKFQRELMKTKGMLDMLFSSVALTGS